MNSNFTTFDNPVTPEQIIAMQDRLIQLEQLFAQSQAQPSAKPQSSTTQPMTDINEEQVFTTLHSLEIRPSYTWQPDPFLAEVLSLDTPLFTSPPLSDDERRKTIEKYPHMDTVQYQPPDTLPIAARKMNKSQTKQDMSLKRLQYLVSGVFRPLDVLGLEINNDVNNENAQRYLHMLADCRSLLLNVSSQINDMRNNIAFQAINPSFRTTPSDSSTNYTMSPTDFQASLVQQTTSVQAIKNASNQRNKTRQFFNNNQQPNTQQFFRFGPSSQQGGYTNNNNSFWNNKNISQNSNSQTSTLELVI